MGEGIVIALISAGIPTVATAITAVIQARTATRNAAKSDILQMIMEDHLAVQEGHLPTNYQNILNAYEHYHKAGGDEFITDKKEEYKRWFHSIEKKGKKKNGR